MTKRIPPRPGRQGDDYYYAKLADIQRKLEELTKMIEEELKRDDD